MLDLLLTPFAQDHAYHAFADTRTILGIPNFWNVCSNLPFFFLGVWGLTFVARNAALVAPLRIVWTLFFVGILATTFGSAYYHLDPDNASLGWDRLAMTIGFMSLFALVIGEYISATWARRLLAPLLLLGAASVYYWLHTEALGAGDLRPYALVQFMPMLLIPLIMLFHWHRSDLGPYLAGLVALYVAAKVFEHYDASIYSAGALMGGHALKHLFAALAAVSLSLGLHRRGTDRFETPVADIPK
jgi:hypothetical protein